MNTDDLAELREAWARAVLLDARGRPEPCWFGENVPGIDECEHGQRGIEGAHWIKRQRVEKTVAQQLEIPEFLLGARARERIAHWTQASKWPELELVFLAAWDPRNGVSACEKHHRRFDGHRVDARDPLVIWRHEVPGHVEAFCRDWPLEVALEDRNPPIGAGI